MNFDFEFALSILPELARATIVTIQATILGMLLAATLGLVLAIARRSSQKWLSWTVTGAVEFIRNTPLLVQIFFLFFVLPDFGITLAPFLCGVIALGIHYSSYTSEVYRAGLDGIQKGQWEAAMALGMPPSMRLRLIIIPQAIPPVIPALGNYLVAMFKDTPLLSAITVLELLQTAKIIGSETFRYLEPLTLVGLIFLVLSLISAAGIRWVENRLSLNYRYAKVSKRIPNLGTAS
ncbi:MAG: ectoine/hydroxyectoine ABC transporter permease subunit EhuD [Elainellaceae cyanobacterium]